MAELYCDILQNVRVIVGTTAVISASSLLNIVKDCVITITCDEAATELEVQLLPLFVTRFSKSPGIHFVSDHDQLPPQTQVNAQDAPTARQLQLSLMRRLIKAGHDFTTSDTQFRMHNDILTLSDTTIYNNIIRNDPSAAVRKGVSEVRKWANNQFSMPRDAKTNEAP